MIERVIVAGSGGQGIMLLGKVLAEAAMLEGKFVTWLPSYGAEVRGGTAHCTVVISDQEIGSPYIDKADTLIIMNAPSLAKFKGRLGENGIMLLNSSLASECAPCPGRALMHPFTDIAVKLGNIKVANMVALGCFLSRKKIVSIKTVQEGMKKIAPPDKKHLIEINQRALLEGAKLK